VSSFQCQKEFNRGALFFLSITQERQHDTDHNLLLGIRVRCAWCTGSRISFAWEEEHMTAVRVEETDEIECCSLSVSHLPLSEWA
jgi:hypothetical protein